MNLSCVVRGSPPRARGAVNERTADLFADRITPACAGSRLRPRAARCAGRDHPRVRGEQGCSLSPCTAIFGSPPRARGAVRVGCSATVGSRITPACAGSRAPVMPRSAAFRDHPRVRGEQAPASEPTAATSGSPPRARGADPAAAGQARAVGITPACAGSRPVRDPPGIQLVDHPRVRGEQGLPIARMRQSRGSPPRARGAELPKHLLLRRTRITPACAGSRHHRAPHVASATDHPRVRGEQAPESNQKTLTPGSPPRARGAVRLGRSRRRRRRITPACAGSRLIDLRR